jgi:hypothetical protein
MTTKYHELFKEIKGKMQLVAWSSCTGEDIMKINLNAEVSSGSGYRRSSINLDDTEFTMMWRWCD